MTDFIPESMMYAVSHLEQVSRNSFRLETLGATTASKNQIVSFVLPENALIDLESIKFFFDVKCSGAGTGADEVFGKLPQHSTSMIQRAEIFANGVQVSQGCSDWGSMCHLIRLCKSSLDKDNSVDRALSHSYLTGDNADDEETLCISQWRGFFEGSTRWLNTGAIGTITIRLTFAGDNVLVPKQQGVLLGADLTTAAAKTNAQQITYSVSNMYMSVDSCSLDETYNAMVRERLASVGLEVAYPDYYTFSLAGVAGAAPASAATRFALSSGCISKIYGSFRDANHQSVGIKSASLGNAAGVSAFTSNQLRFRSFNTWTGSQLLAGSVRNNYQINNIKHKQFDSSVIDNLADVAYVEDKVGDHATSLVTSREAYNDGKYVCPLTLEIPSKRGVGLLAGYNSRSINTNMVWDVRGMGHTASTATGETGVIDSFVVVATKAVMKINLGRDISVLY